MAFNQILIYISIYIGLFAVTFYALSLFSKIKEKHPEFPEKSPPKVSIIIPAWNEEKGIAGTIKSTLEIDYPKDKLEIVVVDDGSHDNTYKIAKKFESKIVHVFRLKKNSGKGEAMNYAISKATGEIIVTTDADNLVVTKDALKKMVAYFSNQKVMCVAPVMVIQKPKGILQRVQQVEYLLGIFLRKAFSSMNAIHITPGAFSAYRKSFFDKYGGFKRAYLTEDLEMALRIQSHNFIIENSLEAVVYTTAINKFYPLMKQRRRWYTGLLRNLWDYKKLFSRKYGAMGLIVLPIALITVLLAVVITLTIVINSLFDIQKQISLLNSVNFNFSTFQITKYSLERFFTLLLSSPMFIFTVIFMSLAAFYMIFAKTRVKENAEIKLSIIFFFAFYSLLFTFWWIVSFIYVFFNRDVSWR